MKNKQTTIHLFTIVWTLDSASSFLLVFLSLDFNYFVRKNKLCNKICMTLSLSPEINKNIWICYV